MNDAPEAFTLHFGTKPNELDATTLVDSLGAIEAVLRELNSLNQGATTMAIRVLPFKKGSFEIPMEIQQLAAATALALTPGDCRSAADLLKMMVELIKLSVLLGGKKRKTITEEGENVKISGTKGPVTYVDNRTYNIFNGDAVVCESFARGFGSLEANKQVKRLKLLDGKRKVMLNVPRRQFPFLKDRTIGAPQAETVQRERIELIVYKVVFEAGPRWKFIYRGFKVPAIIKDPAFLEKVKEGEAFANGDVLDVDLATTREYDPNSQTYVNKTYQILKVHRHTRRAKQSPLALPE